MKKKITRLRNTKKTTTMQRIENGKTMMEQANPQQTMNEAKEKSLFVKFPPLLKKLFHKTQIFLLYDIV